MRKECEIVSDLLPLYVDDVCSLSSRELVEAHIEECEDCRILLDEMRHDMQFETALIEEKELVIDLQKKIFQKRSALIGTVIGGVLCIPVLICLIANLVTGHGLSWFFIVLAALLLTGSCIVVPLMCSENRWLWTLGSSTVSLLLLLAVCAIYTAGKWFWVASTGCIFGLSVIFLPFVMVSRPVKEKLRQPKVFLIISIDLLLFGALLGAVGFYKAVLGLTEAGAVCGIVGVIFILVLLIFEKVFYRRK